MLIERNSGDTSVAGHIIVSVPCIKTSIASTVKRNGIEGGYCSFVERAVIRDIVLVEWLSIFGENNVSVVWNRSSDNTCTIAPKAFYLFFCSSIWFFLI